MLPAIHSRHVELGFSSWNPGDGGETVFVRTTVRIRDKISIATRVPVGGSS